MSIAVNVLLIVHITYIVFPRRFRFKYTPIPGDDAENFIIEGFDFLAMTGSVFIILKHVNHCESQ